MFKLWNLASRADLLDRRELLRVGGLSLAGFPLLTAGFWSKDEILADAWHGLTEGYGPHALVFVMLALAAFLTISMAVSGCLDG